jgi:hypothetical protein
MEDLLMHTKKVISKKKANLKRKASRRKERVPDVSGADIIVAEPRGFGPETAGQSGDTEGVSDVAEGNSESVMELIEEGQDREAEAVSAIESAPEPDQAEVTTHERRG